MKRLGILILFLCIWTIPISNNAFGIGFVDNFDDGIIDSNIWTTTGQVEENDGIVTLNRDQTTDTAEMYTKAPYTFMNGSRAYVTFQGDVWNMGFKSPTSSQRLEIVAKGTVGMPFTYLNAITASGAEAPHWFLDYIYGSSWNFTLDWSAHTFYVEGSIVDGDTDQPTFHYALSDPCFIPNSGEMLFGFGTGGKTHSGRFDNVKVVSLPAPDTNYVDDTFNGSVISSEWDHDSTAYVADGNLYFGLVDSDLYSRITSTHRWTSGKATIEWDHCRGWLAVSTAPGYGDGIYIKEDGGDVNYAQYSDHWRLQIKKNNKWIELGPDWGITLGTNSYRPIKWEIYFTPTYLEVEGTEKGHTTPDFTWSTSDTAIIPQGPFRLGLWNYYRYQAKMYRLAVEPFTYGCGDLQHPYPPGDINHDCIVSFADFGQLASAWATDTDPSDARDLNHDGRVNLVDLRTMAESWLYRLTVRD